MARQVISQYFAGIDVTVKLSSPQGGIINTLSDTEKTTVMQCVYMALNSFCYIRTLYLAEQGKLKDKNGG